MFIWTKNKTIIVVVAFVVAIASATFSVYFAPTSNASVSISRIDTNGSQFVVGDEFSATAQLSDWKYAMAVNIFVDGKYFNSCSIGSSCEFSFVATPSDIGEHEYEFVVTDKKGQINKKSGKYTILTDLPELKSITTNSANIPVGGAFFAKLDATSASPITSAKLYIDGALAQTCTAMPCVVQIGVLTSKDVGEHVYTFEVVNGKEKTITPGGTFTVVPVSNDPKSKEPKVVVSSPEITTLTLSKTPVAVGETLTINVTAKDEKGIVAIMLFIDGKYVGGCDQTPTCLISIADFNNSNIGVHKYKVIVINKDGKTIEADGSFSVVAKKVASIPAGEADNNSPVPVSPVVIPPTSTDPKTGSEKVDPSEPVQPSQPPVDESQTKTTTPQIEYTTTGGNKYAVGETFFANILLKNKSGIKEITGYIDNKLISKCDKITWTCHIKKGPLTVKDVGEHTYYFSIKPKSGNTIKSEGKFTVYNPSAGVLPVIIAGMSLINSQDLLVVPSSNQETLLIPKIPLDTSGTKALPLWIDTDGGINEFNLGRCVSNVLGASFQKYVQDFCLDISNLNEYYVSAKADKCLSTVIKCAGTCYDGVCISAGHRPGAGFELPPTTAEEALADPPTRVGAGYEPPTRVGAGYNDSTDAPLPVVPTAADTPPVVVPSVGTSVVIPSVSESMPIPQDNTVIEPTDSVLLPTTRIDTEIPAVDVSPSWEDTDGGIYPNVYGECRSLKYATQKITPDYCLDRSTLIENYMDASGINCLQKAITCTNGCSLGKCTLVRPTTTLIR
ncbi:MAG: hypothetical protein WCV83_03330 [Candidatus Magasanikbacteria bacterium]|jgi:hypothetical protein